MRIWTAQIRSDVRLGLFVFSEGQFYNAENDSRVIWHPVEAAHPWPWSSATHPGFYQVQVVMKAVRCLRGSAQRLWGSPDF